MFDLAQLKKEEKMQKDKLYTIEDLSFMLCPNLIVSYSSNKRDRQEEISELQKAMKSKENQTDRVTVHEKTKHESRSIRKLLDVPFSVF